MIRIGKGRFYLYNEFMEFIKNINNQRFFSIFGLVFIGLGWLAFLLALAGIFYSWILGIILILGSAFIVYVAILNKKNLKLKWDILVVILTALGIIIIFSNFTVPTVFSGRDQGSFSNAAIGLAKNHSLKSSFPAEQEFFKIYGQGVALNFPGFNYDSTGNLVPSFFLGYIVWLAIFFSIFGLKGLVIANGVSFFIFLLSFYFLAKNYLKKYRALAAFFLIITSFIFSWFFKFTLSENLALALIWFGLLQFIWFLRKNDKLFLVSFLASFGLLLFVRIEGVAFLIMALIAFYFLGKNKKLPSRKNLLKYILIFLILVLIFFAVSFSANKPAYIAIAKGFLNSFNFSQNSSGTGSGILGFIKENIYLLQIFTLYAILIYFVFGLIGLIYFFKKRKFEILIPLFILSPAFIYLINPSVTPDHPWMLRRYVFATVPISILYTTLFLNHFLKKRFGFYLLFSVLLLSNLIVFVPNLNLKENDTLLPQVEKISQNFQDNDLVLIDRGVTGDPWAMISGPMNVLLGKQSVYFFNPNDLDKIDRSKFNNIYLIVPNENFDFYQKDDFIYKFSSVKDYVIRKESLNVSDEKKSNLYGHIPTSPLHQEEYVYGKIYLLK